MLILTHQTVVWKLMVEPKVINEPGDVYVTLSWQDAHSGDRRLFVSLSPEELDELGQAVDRAREELAAVDNHPALRSVD